MSDTDLAAIVKAARNEARNQYQGADIRIGRNLVIAICDAVERLRAERDEYIKQTRDALFAANLERTKALERFEAKVNAEAEQSRLCRLLTDLLSIEKGCDLPTCNIGGGLCSYCGGRRLEMLDSARAAMEAKL